jgi:hypothetical protein
VQTHFEFRTELPVWWFSLNNDQTNELIAGMGLPNKSKQFVDFLEKHGVVAASNPVPILGQIADVLAVRIIYIDVVNKLGGSNGVDFNGVIGTNGVIVTPHNGADSPGGTLAWRRRGSLSRSAPWGALSDSIHIFFFSSRPFQFSGSVDVAYFRPGPGHSARQLWQPARYPI